MYYMVSSAKSYWSVKTGMPRLTLESKELKTILKTFSAFSAQSIRKHPVVTFIFDPSFRMIMSTDSAYIAAVPRKVTDWDQQSVPYSFTPDTLLELALSEKDTTLGWVGDRSALEVKNGRFASSLKVAAAQPIFDHVPQDTEIFPVPLGTLAAINQYLSIPQSYYKKKSELMPVQFKRDRRGKLIAMADDGYSLGKVETEIDCPCDLDVKIPKYVLDTLYSGASVASTEPVGFGVKGFSVTLGNQEIKVCTSGVSDQMVDFDTVYAGLNPWTVSATFNPKLLARALKPFISLIPTKERSGSFIEMEVRNKVTLSLRQKDIGDAKVDEVEGFEEVRIESAAPRALIQMHPQAFNDYTNLLDLNQALMFANLNSVFYQATQKLDSGSLTLKYLFPTVSV
jgi:hypothetical protein